VNKDYSGLLRHKTNLDDTGRHFYSKLFQFAFEAVISQRIIIIQAFYDSVYIVNIYLRVKQIVVSRIACSLVLHRAEDRRHDLGLFILFAPRMPATV